MSTQDRPGELPVPPYRWVQGVNTGCEGCAFRKQLAIRCSRIPCQHRPGMVAKLIPVAKGAAA